MSAVACPDAIMAPGGSGRPPQLFGPSTAGEVALLRAARETRPEVDYSGCTRELLAELSRRRGIDFATAFFYDRITRLGRNRLLFDALGDPRFDGETPFARGRVLIVPALFFRERPEIGGDGAVVARVAEAAGLEARVLPVRSGGTAAENAALLREMLPAQTMDPTVVVSLSKGAADLRLALEDMPLPAGLRAWVIVSGLLRGTPAIDWMRARWWRRLVLQRIVRSQGGSDDLPREFGTIAELPLNRPAASPPGLTVVNLVGCPLARHVSTRFGRMRHRQMARLGPNDGLALLRDTILEPGLVYPVWGADHYFNLPAVPVLLRRLIAYFCLTGCLDGLGSVAGMASANSPECGSASRWRFT